MSAVCEEEEISSPTKSAQVLMTDEKKREADILTDANLQKKTNTYSI